MLSIIWGRCLVRLALAAVLYSLRPRETRKPMPEFSFDQSLCELPRRDFCVARSRIHRKAWVSNVACGRKKARGGALSAMQSRRICSAEGKLFCACDRFPDNKATAMRGARALRATGSRRIWKRSDPDGTWSQATVIVVTRHGVNEAYNVLHVVYRR